MKQIGHVTMKGTTLAVTELKGEAFKAVLANPDTGIARKNGKEKIYRVDAITEVLFIESDELKWCTPWVEDGSYDKSKYNASKCYSEAKKLMKEVK